MREILFKAKRIDNGEWAEGYVVKYGFTNREKFYIVPEYASDLYGFEVDPSTICQYTGLNDMNGQKIWENDILCGQLDESYPDDKTYAQVLWHKNGWYTKENGGIDYQLMDEFDEHFFAVVGNVFDNAELLK